MLTAPRPTVALLLSLTLVSAGCLGGGDLEAGEQAQQAAPVDLTTLYTVEHDHTDPIVHDTAWNLTELARHPLTTDGTPQGVAGEIDVADDLAVVHVQGPRSGLVVLDVSDPTDPEMLGYADAEAYRPFEGRDAKIEPGGGYAYLALQSGGLPVGAVPADEAPASADAAGGFLVIDLSDPSDPTIVAQAREPGRGCHMIRYWEDGGTRVVYCASTAGMAIWELVDGPLGPRTPVRAGQDNPADPEGVARTTETYLDPGAPTAAQSAAYTYGQPHDMTAQEDPLTGDPVLAVAQELYGLRLLDISDPTNPTEIGAWNGSGAEHFHRVHTALLTEADDRRIAVAVTETSGQLVPALFLVDMTDPQAPELLAEWNPPNGATTEGSLYSTHNIQVVGTTLYMAHFHAGVLAFDISDPSDPVVEAAYQVTGAPLDADTAGSFGGAPSIWDVVVHDGYVLASDIPSGLVVLHKVGDPAGDPDWKSFV